MVLQILLQSHDDDYKIDTYEKSGRIALIRTYEYNNENIAQTLPAKGVDVNAQRGYFNTAICAATAKSHDQIAQLLLVREGPTSSHVAWWEDVEGHVQTTCRSVVTHRSTI